MSNTPIILVIGIDDRQGESVARAFLKLNNVKVWGLTSSPNPAIIPKWAIENVEVECVDYNNEPALRKACEGATHIFSVIAYWKHLADHSVDILARMTGRRHAEIAHEVGVRQGLNIARAVSSVGTLQRFVLSVLPGIKARSGGLIDSVYHFDTKWEVVKYLERLDPVLVEKTSLVAPGFFMEECWKFMQEREDGSMILATGLPPDCRVPWIHGNDIGNFVVALCRDLEPKRFVAAYAETKSFLEICETIQSISGKRVGYCQYSAAELERRYPLAGQLLADQWDFIAKHGYYIPHLLDRSNLARDYGIQIEVTDFEKFLAKDLPMRFGVDIAQQGNGSGVPRAVLDEDWMACVNWPDSD